MLPHKHFIFSAILIIITALFFFPSLSYTQMLIWVLIGGALSILVDLDSTILLAISKDKALKPYRNFIYLNKHFNQFIKIIAKNGILRTAAKTHIILSALFVALSYLLWPAYLTPSLIGIASHLLSDIPALRYL